MIPENAFNFINNPYVLPVKRVGNSCSPKLVILLSNPGDDWRMPRRLPDYTMCRDGAYSDQGVAISVAQEYNAWWDDIVDAVRDVGMAPDDILALEYYPYHTVSSAEIPRRRDWTDYAQCALSENIDILRQCIQGGVPVFGYYHGMWSRTVPELYAYPHFYKSTQAWKNNKVKELRAFLSDLAK